jgi:1,4-dihydroxy-2-naphthoate octaprenyltransferase
LLGSRGAARVYAAVALIVPLWIAVAVAGGFLPRTALIAVLPSLLLLPPLRWVFRDPSGPIPNAALGANVAWILGTNLLLALGLLLGI